MKNKTLDILEKVIEYYKSTHLLPFNPEKYRVESVLPILTRYNEFNALFELLEDEESKKALEYLIKLRILSSILSLEQATEIFPWNMPMSEYREVMEDCRGLPDYAQKDNLRDAAEIWKEEIYRVPGIFDAEPGDFVIDAGAYSGNSSIWYSQKVGNNGKIFAFEPSPTIFKKLTEHVLRFGAGNCFCYNYALSDKPEIRYFSDIGLGAYLNHSGDESVNVDTIDNWMSNLSIEKIDLIKFDIEGEEANAIRGAAETIKMYTPRLAVSAYHTPDDIIVLPALIQSLNPAYKFYLRISAPDEAGAVLFCIKRDGCEKSHPAKQDRIESMDHRTLRLATKYFSFALGHLKDKYEAEITKLHKETAQLHKETAQLHKETAQLRRETARANNQIARMRLIRMEELKEHYIQFIKSEKQGDLFLFGNTPYLKEFIDCIYFLGRQHDFALHVYDNLNFEPVVLDCGICVEVMQSETNRMKNKEVIVFAELKYREIEKQLDEMGARHIWHRLL